MVKHALVERTDPWQTRAGEIGSRALVVLAVVIAGLGLSESGASTESYILPRYAAAAAPGLILGLIALLRPSVLTWCIAGVVAATYGVVVGIVLLVGARAEVVRTLTLLLLACGALVAAALLVDAAVSVPVDPASDSGWARLSVARRVAAVMIWFALSALVAGGLTLGVIWSFAAG